jgi:hypothetical protein
MIPAVDVSVVEARLAGARARREEAPLPWWLRTTLLIRRSRRFAHRAVLARACALLLPAGCGGGAGRSAVSVRDSAGIRIVEAAAPAWPEGGGWRLSAEPRVAIGAAEGAEENQLFRVGGVSRFADGRIAVVNGGSSELRIYSAEGRHLQSIGREGAGPGEFRFPRTLWLLAGDSLLVVDLDKLSWFDGAGAFVRSEPLGNPRPMLRFADGSYLGMAFAPGEDFYAPGQVRPRVSLLRSRPAGAPDTLAILAGDDAYRLSHDRGISVYAVPFGLRRALAVHEMSVYTGDGSAFEVAVLDTAGRVTLIARRPDTDRTVTPADVRRYGEIRLGALPAAAPDDRVRRVLREAKVPATKPAWDQLVVDAAGGAWIRHFALERDAPATWSVFDAEGRWLGEIGMPVHFEVKEIGADYVLGTWTDELGVEYVRLYDLEKG